MNILSQWCESGFRKSEPTLNFSFYLLYSTSSPQQLSDPPKIYLNYRHPKGVSIQETEWQSQCSHWVSQSHNFGRRNVCFHIDLWLRSFFGFVWWKKTFDGQWDFFLLFFKFFFSMIWCKYKKRKKAQHWKMQAIWPNYEFTT